MSRKLLGAICGDCRWGEPSHECASTALGIVPEVSASSVPLCAISELRTSVARGPLIVGKRT